MNITILEAELFSPRYMLYSAPGLLCMQRLESSKAQENEICRINRERNGRSLSYDGKLIA